MKNSTNKIIKTIAICLIVFLGTASTQAQKVAFGFRYMPTFSALDLKNSTGGSVKGEATLGHGWGGLIAFNCHKIIGMQVEVIYSQVTQKYKEADVERNIKLKYVNIPLLVSLNTGVTHAINLNVVAGPQIGVSVGTEVSVSGGTSGNTQSQAIVAVKKGDLGLAYGAGIDFGLNSLKTVRLALGYRGVLGLIDISNNSQTAASGSYYILDKTSIKTNAAYLGFTFLF